MHPAWWQDSWPASGASETRAACLESWFTLDLSWPMAGRHTPRLNSPAPLPLSAPERRWVRRVPCPPAALCRCLPVVPAQERGAGKGKVGGQSHPCTANVQPSWTETMLKPSDEHGRGMARECAGIRIAMADAAPQRQGASGTGTPCAPHPDFIHAPQSTIHSP